MVDGWSRSARPQFPHQVRGQDEFAAAARETRGVRRTVESDGREIGLAQATIGDQVEGRTLRKGSDERSLCVTHGRQLLVGLQNRRDGYRAGV